MAFLDKNAEKNKKNAKQAHLKRIKLKVPLEPKLKIAKAAQWEKAEVSLEESGPKIAQISVWKKKTAGFGQKSEKMC